jgi:hypothetical protein
MFDRRVNGWITVNAYLFNATFDDSLSCEIQVNPEFGSSENALIEAETYGVEIGRLPTCLRDDVETVWIHLGTEYFGGGNNNLLIHTGQAADYISDGILEEVLVHEACHTSLDAYHASSSGWLDAQSLDNNFISNYAQDNPTQEDIAESFLVYLAVQHRSDRISQSTYQTITQTIPNRIQYFNDQNFNMYPITPPAYEGPVWHVATSGSDDNNGSEEYPFATIQAGIDAASDGDTVLVAAGTYDGISISGKNITVMTTENAVIDGNNTNQTVQIGNGSSESLTNFEINGFTLQAGAGDGCPGDYCQFGSVKIYNWLDAPQSYIFKYLKFINHYEGVTPGLISIDDRNIDSRYILIENCTFANNQNTKLFELYSIVASIEIKNSIIDIPDELDLAYWLEAWDSMPNTNISYSVFPASFSDESFPEGVTLGANVLYENPLFCNPENGDYTLAANSPAVGSGENDVNMGAFGVGCGIIDLKIYVSNTGSDETGDGSVENPFATIQHGIDASSNSDTVLVSAGTYVETINYNGKNIVVGSLYLTTQDTSYISSTIIDGNQSGGVVTFESGEDSLSVLSGFTIQNGYKNSNPEDGAGIFIYNAAATLDHLIIKDNVAERYGGGIAIQGIGTTIISNTYILNNNAANYGGGVIVRNSDVDFQNCIIINNISGGSGSALHITKYGGGNQDGGTVNLSDCLISNNISSGNEPSIYATDFNLSITNCTIANNSGAIWIDQQDLESQLNIINTIIWDSGELIMTGDLASNITYSNIQGSWEGEGNIDNNPLFCNPYSEDYTLASNSPCIDAGDPNTPTDPDGTIANMGAYDVGCGPISLLSLWYVAIGGSDDTGDGTEESPFETIQRGIDASSNGDTVLVQPGTYVENINYNGKNITVGSLMLITGDTSYISQTIIEGQGLDGPWWENETVLFESQEDSSAVFQGFTINNGIIAAKQYNFPYGSSPTLTNLIIDNGVVNSWSAPTILLENSIVRNTETYDGLLGGVSLKNCKIYNNTAQYLSGGLSVFYENTLIYNNTVTAETAIGSWGSTFINCTIVNNTIDGIGGIIEVNGMNEITTTIINSIIWNNSPCIGFPEDPTTNYCGAGQINYIMDPSSFGGQTGLIISNSIVMGIDESPAGLGLVLEENVSSTNPGFDENYNLLNGSFAISGGIDSTLLEVWIFIEDESDPGMGTNELIEKWFYTPTTDIDGNPRPNPVGSNKDIGAYESPLAEPQLSYTMATFETDGSIIGGLTMLDDNTLYAVSSNDKVYRLDGNLNYYYFLDVDGEIKSASTVTSDHNVYIASTDQNLYSFNASGITNDDWPRAMGSEVTASVAVDGDGNLYIGTENGIFQAVSPTNESLWASNLGAAVYASACISIDNKLYIPISDGRIICYNLNTINPSSPMFEWLLPTGSGIVSSPALDADGNIYVGTLDGRLIKVQDNGNSASIVWEVVTGDSIIASPIIDGNGNILIGSNDGFFYSISPEGTINWAIETGGKVRSTAAIGGNGNIYFGSDDYKLFAVDSTGSVVWHYYASSPISSPVLASGNKIYFGEENGLVVKLTESSNRTISRNQPMWGTFQGNNKRTGSQSDSNLGNENSISIPTQFTLHQNYPNPFNPVTTLQYDLPEDALVNITIYDMMGRSIKSLVNNNQSAGYRSIQWNATNNLGEPVSAGMYIYTIQAGEFRQTKKMVLLK